MIERKPVAFLSYVRTDDEHDGGKISQFRLRLEGEVRMQTGRSFEIFQDRNDLKWGQSWEERIKKSLSDVTFLIPVITPSFFVSPACRHEFETFLQREQTLGSDRLILPLYYVSADELLGDSSEDSIATILKKRQWTDWRPYRFRSFADEDVASALAAMAQTIKISMQELYSINATAKAKLGKSPDIQADAVEPDIVEKAPEQIAVEVPSIELDLGYLVPEARPDGPFDSAHFKIVSQNDYYAYTRQYDEVLLAKEYDPDDQMKLFRFLARKSASLERVNRKKIDALVEQMKPANSNVAIILLLDNSGSMRGTPILNLAAWTHVVMSILERFSVITAVLGYTTRAWRGGGSKDLWLADGSPKKPGRLNDVRHIIYKNFSDRFSDSYPNLGLMLREGILKENLDGEALLWAYSQISKVSFPKKIIIVLSDGAPVDDSTIDANSVSKRDSSGTRLLGNHLKAVAAQVAASDVELIAMGAASRPGEVHGAKAYYPNFVEVDSWETVGLSLIEAIADILSA